MQHVVVVIREASLLAKRGVLYLLPQGSGRKSIHSASRKVAEQTSVKNTYTQMGICHGRGRGMGLVKLFSHGALNMLFVVTFHFPP